MFDWVKLTFRAVMRVETNYIEKRVRPKSGGIMVVDAKEIGAIAPSCRFLADIKNMCYKSIAIRTYTIFIYIYSRYKEIGMFRYI